MMRSVHVVTIGCGFLSFALIRCCPPADPLADLATSICVSLSSDRPMSVQLPTSQQCHAYTSRCASLIGECRPSLRQPSTDHADMRAYS